MPEVASQADISWNDELWIGPLDGSTGTVTAWTQVFGVETVGMPEQMPEDIDVTHQQSPGRTRETIPGLLPVADYTQELQDWPNDPGQDLLDALAALTAAGTRENIGIEMNVGGRRRTYRGYTNSFTPNGTVGEKRMSSVSFKIMDRLPTNPRTVA